ncbi:MAG: hypothetical protein K1X28_00535 [Parachlamydiales bacterium]|nr:hypothetical protein [Parachlamydiales bacterium]
MDTKRAFDLAVLAGQKRLSPRTGFVHLHPHDETTDTIPIYENFCYALALFRQRTKESVLSAIELVEKLLPFQSADGNFPVYLHEYPKCHDYHMGLKAGAILTYILRLFSNVLGELKPKWEKALEKALTFQTEKPLWMNRVRAIRGLPLLPYVPQTAAEWIEHLINGQLSGQTEFQMPYDPSLHLFPLTGQQEKGEPRPHPIEWILSEGNYTSRLSKDHPHQLLCAPLFPFQCIPTHIPEHNLRLFWQGLTLHSLVGQGLIFDLKENGEDDVVLYCDRSPETQIWVDGKKATTFQFGNTITIQTPQKTIELRFKLTEGSGDFCGHIFPANRPSQIAKGFEAYDWHIGMRTLRRSPTARIEIEILQDE